MKSNIDIIDEIKDLLASRIAPGLRESGGSIVFHSFVEGNLYLKVEGSAYSMIAGVKNMFRYYIPEIKMILDYREASPRPGLKTPEAISIKKLFEEKVNPSIVDHGGHISLVDLKDNIVYVRLDGGCQGCSMADITLKDFIVNEIKDIIPAITEVRDVTQHADGGNPWI